MRTYDENLNWLVPNDMAVTDDTLQSDIGAKIREIYTKGEPLADHIGDGVRVSFTKLSYCILNFNNFQYASDSSFTRSIIKHAELYSGFADTYFYQFSYDGQIGAFDVHYDGAENVSHSEDYRYIFCAGTECDASGYPESDQITVERIIKIWTNFAKYQ